MNQRSIRALNNMRSNALQALSYARRSPNWREDDMARDAIAKRVEELSEVAKTRFPRALRAEYSQLEWDEIAGMRDVLVHDYAGLDLDILEEVVTHDLPRLIEEINKLLLASDS